jgi:tetratricopeptide (TPR) repeat protein
MTNVHRHMRSIFVAASATLGAVSLSAALGACNGPRQIQERPVLVTGDRVGSADSVIAALRLRTALEQQGAGAARDSLMLAATRDCAPAVCAAISRGELTVGMTEAQVLAATRSAPAAWSIRRSGGSAVMVAGTLDAPPADVIGEVALVQMAGGRVSSIGYRESQGMRVVSSAADATTEGRARATADALVREGDALTAAGDAAAALDRYDRALVLAPNDAMLQYRVATLLDQQLRPIEALMRYQRFLQQYELQRIEAVGHANATLADAIARAQQRVIVLERQAR